MFGWPVFFDVSKLGRYNILKDSFRIVMVRSPGAPNDLQLYGRSMTYRDAMAQWVILHKEKRWFSTANWFFNCSMTRGFFRIWIHSRPLLDVHVPCGCSQDGERRCPWILGTRLRHRAKIEAEGRRSDQNPCAPAALAPEHTDPQGRAGWNPGPGGKLGGDLFRHG